MSYSTSSTDQARLTGYILSKLAARLVERHGDRWLEDAVSTPRSPAAAEGFAALARAVESQDAGYPITAGDEARRALCRFQLAHSKAGEMRAELELTCAEHAGNLEESAASEREALRIGKEAGYDLVVLRAIGFTAERSALIGNLAEGWRQNARGLLVYWTGNYPLRRAQQFYSELSFLAARNRVAFAAAALSRETTEITGLLGRRDLHAAALQQLAVTEISAGFQDAAMTHLRQSASLAAALRTLEQRRMFALYTEIAMAALEASRGELDRPLRRLLRIQDQADRANTLLRLRFRAELGQLRLRRGEYTESRRLLESALRIGELSRKLTFEAERPVWTRTMGYIYRALVECSVRGGVDPQQSWALWSSYGAALLDRAASVSPDAVAINPGEALLSFAELPSGMAAWLQTTHGFYFRRLELARVTVERFVRGCSNEWSPDTLVRADARQVSQWLLDPWDKELDSVRTLTIESNGTLSALPWLALVRANGHYWSDDVAIRIRLGAGRQSEPAAQVSSAERALVVGAPATSAEGDPPSIPEAMAEAKEVSSLSSRSITLRGQVATLIEVRRRLGEAELFHFAGHGFGSDGGGLIVARGDGAPALLQAVIQNLNLSRCRLAVLSACSAGAGERDGAGDPQSLVRAFLRAGTREVVASYWNLNFAAAGTLMREFYASLLSGAPTAESLRRAAAAVRSRRPYAHPYYRAGLEVFSMN